MFEDLNLQQRAAVDHTGSPLLIVAGAGTGKTKTLVARVVRLIDDGADPNRILLLTFTRRSATEMIGRVAASSTDRAATQVWGGTFHAIANRLLRQYGSAAGLSATFTVLDQGDSTDLFGLVRNDADRSVGKRFPRKETITGIYGRMVNSQAKLIDVLESDYPWCAEHIDELKDIFTAYTAQKRVHQVLDYDDLLLFWRGVLASPIGGTVRDLFDHVLIDEYQDTNPTQSDIIRGLVRGPDHPNPTGLCAVGDDAQAIYGFRAASVENMWAFSDHFPGATVVTLEQNYRSTTPILAVANEVLAQPIGGDTNHHFRKELWSTRATGTVPKLVTANDEGDQSRYVADAVLDARERGIDLREQAVLFRAGHHSDGLELELTRRDIPFVKYGGLKYLEAAHVKDLLSLLRILDNPADQLAWHRVLHTLEGVGPATVRKIVDELGLVNGASPDAVPSPTNDGALARFIDGIGKTPGQAATQVAELRAALGDCSGDDMPPAEQVDRLKPFCALVFPSNYENAAARLADIEQLAATAGAYGSRSRFLTELTLDPPSKSSDRAGPPHLDDDWLTLSTIHSAKGMEWRTVHLLHAADGNLPSDMAIGDNDGLAEELRLLYVALTRAKDELTVTFPLRYHVNRYATDDRHLYAQLSRFLEPMRTSFDEIATSEGREDAVLDLTNVGIADEVDTALHALWD
ncbi:MAG: DNA helicase-2/ATP-dependent DNA helicase PcrA [Acidimicrobiales bacterium]|jgi:DNA helicase-2/ATP-dependent DNA helicase PcrA